MPSSSPGNIQREPRDTKTGIEIPVIVTDKQLQEELKEKAVLETSAHVKEVSAQVSELKNFVETRTSSEVQVYEELKQMRSDMEQLRVNEQEAQEKAQAARQEAHEAQLRLQRQEGALQEKERCLAEAEARSSEHHAKLRKLQEKLQEEIKEHRQSRLGLDEAKRLLTVMQEEREAQEDEKIAHSELAAETVTNRENEIEALQRRVRQLNEQVNRTKVREGTLEQQVKLKEREIEEMRRQRETEFDTLALEKQAVENQLTDLGDRYQSLIVEAERESRENRVLLEQLDAAAAREQVAAAREHQLVQEVASAREKRLIAEEQVVAAHAALQQAEKAAQQAEKAQQLSAAAAAKAAADAAAAAAMSPALAHMAVDMEGEADPFDQPRASMGGCTMEDMEREIKKLRETVQHQKGMLQEQATQWRREQNVTKLLTPGEYQSMAKRYASETGAAEIAQLKVRSAGLDIEVADLRRKLEAARRHGPPQMWVAVDRELANALGGAAST